MRDLRITIPFLCALISCKTQPGSDRHYADGDPTKVYNLQLTPKDGATYDYTITNETEFKVETGDKKVDNQNLSTVDLSYAIEKDSAGNILLTMRYSKIHLHSKSGEAESDMDMDNPGSVDPAERLLSLLKGVSIQALVTPRGKLLSVKGYDSLREKILTSFNPNDTYGRQQARKEWDQRVGKGLIQKNVEQLFQLFPDSAIHVGDRWRLHSKETNQVALSLNNEFMLTDIHNGLADISVHGDIASDSSAINSMGYNVDISLKGKEDGEISLETATGMMQDSKIRSEIEGTMTVAGRQAPVTITSTVKVERKKQ